jgi:phosphoglycerol transferase
MSLRRSALFYGALAILAAYVLSQLPPLRWLPLRVPVTYERDGLFLTILSKTIREDGFLHATRFGAPFGTDLADWPIGMWLPFAQLAGLTALSGEPGTAINLYWISTIVIAALAAAYALRRLRLPPGLAFVLGMLYAFQPYAFYRNVEHVNLAFPFVPLLALLLLRVAGTRPEDETRGERVLTLAACVAQGLSYIYYSAFACLLLAAAAPFGWWRARSLRPLRRAALGIALLAVCSAATVAPTLVYWKRHGYNPDLDYKPPRETEVYALKLRHLLTPIADHPLAPFREVARKLDAAGFADDDKESAFSRLGSVASLGLLALIVFLLGRAAGLLPRREEALDGAAPLALFTLLWASAGGFASFFNVFVISDIRCYTRIIVFLSFFCVLAFGAFVTRAAGLLPLAPRLRAPVRWAGLAALLSAGLADQIPLDHLWTLRKGSVAAFDEERQLVSEVEARLPAGAMVFQLPHMTLPVDRATYPPMRYYDPGRAYLHSRALRWSWGAMIGRQHDWGRAVDALPLPEKVRVLAESGFSGIWIDRWGYTGKERPPYADLEQKLGAILGEPFLVSARGRYSFVSIEGYRRELEARLGPERLARVRHERLADMPILEWRDGCGQEARTPDGWWRPCGALGRLEIRNWRTGALQVSVSARFRARSTRTLAVTGLGFAEHLALTPAPLGFQRTFLLDGEKLATLELRCDCREPVSVAGAAAQAAGAPAACFEVSGLQIATHRMIDGVPVNDDWGVATRTKQ